MFELFNQLLFAGMIALVSLYSRSDLYIFLDDSATEPQAQRLQQEIRQIDGVTEVIYVSQQQAYEIYVEQNKDDPELVELITPEVMPASIEVHTNSRAARTRVMEFAEQNSIVDEVREDFLH